MPVLKNNKVVPSDFRPNTAIILATSNLEKGKKNFPRPWSKGPIEQFGLGDILPQFNDLVDKEKRQVQTDTLLDLFELMDGSKWLFNDGWADALSERRTVGSENIDPGAFRGIEMDETKTNVIGFEFPRNDIHGFLPTAFYTHLTELITLTLNSNHIKGKLPGLLGHLTHLQHLDLSNNLLTGPLPEAISNLTALETVRFQDNKLTGPVPVFEGSRQTLTVLNLCNNKLSGNLKLFGTMPPPPPAARGRDGRILLLTNAEISTKAMLAEERELAGPWPKLREFIMGQNRITGNVSLLEMPYPELQHFSICNNKITGSLPLITKTPNLRFLFLDHNRLTGPLIEPMFSLTQLKILSLNGNQLTGCISPQVSQLVNLTDLWLSFNKLSGRLPVEGGLSHLKGQLQVLGVTGNTFDPDPAVAVGTLGLEHHDLPEATTANELVEMLQELDGSSEGPTSVGIKNITVLKRDRVGASGGEDAVKVAQGDKNWKDIQKLMAKIEEDKQLQNEALAAELEAKQWAAAERSKIDQGRAAQMLKEKALKEQKKRGIRDGNTSGPRIAQQLVDAQAARKQRQVELERRRRDEFG